MNQPKVLVLDGESRSALAVVRSLGKAGYSVGVAASHASALAAKSRYCDYVFLAPNAATAPETFMKWLGMMLADWEPNVLIPVTDLSMTLCLRAAHEISRYTVLPTPSKHVFDQVTDKGNLMQVARSLGLHTPETVLLPSVEDWSYDTEQLIRRIPYPAVLKTRCSINDLGARIVQGPMFYVAAPEEVLDRLHEATEQVGRAIPYILQQKVDGVGVGVFSICLGGESLAEFCHQRVLEKPPSGGRSVLCESIPEEAAPVRESLALLKHLNWQGVAMVEFKKAPDGTCYLMEINPRFWGSLQLAVDCGRDFPTILVELCLHENPDPTALRQEWNRRLGPYLVGHRLRWLLGTVDHVLIRLKSNFFDAAKDIFTRNSLQLWIRRKQTRAEVCRVDDLGPFFCELRSYLFQFFGYGPR